LGSLWNSKAKKKKASKAKKPVSSGIWAPPKMGTVAKEAEFVPPTRKNQSTLEVPDIESALVSKGAIGRAIGKGYSGVPSVKGSDKDHSDKDSTKILKSDRAVI